MPKSWKMGLGIIAFVFVLSIWWIGGHYPIWKFPKEAASLNPGTFGDSFGFINSFFSGLAFAIAMVALAVQATQSRKANEIANRTALLTNHKIKADTIADMMKSLDQIQSDLLILKAKQEPLIRKSSDNHADAQKALTAEIRKQFARITSIQTEMMLMFYQSGYTTRETLKKWKDYIVCLNKLEPRGTMKFHSLTESALEHDLQLLMTATSDAVYELVEAIARELETAFPITNAS